MAYRQSFRSNRYDCCSIDESELETNAQKLIAASACGYYGGAAKFCGTGIDDLLRSMTKKALTREELTQLTEGLKKLAHNLWWTWDQGAQEIFHELSPRGWQNLVS